MKIDLITETAAFARLEPEWRALESAPGLLGLFHGYTWQFEWWKALGGARSLRLLVARNGGRTVGLLPLYEERREGIKRLALIGSPGGGSDYLEALCVDDGIRRALIEAAAGLGADLIELEDLLSTSPFLPAVLDHARVTHRFVECVPRFPCPFIPVNRSFREYQETLARRENLRRRAKWFSAQPGFRIVRESSPEATGPFLDRFFRLHAARWREDGGSQAFSDARLVAFHRAVTARLAEEGRLQLWTLWVAGEAVAVAYAFEDRGRSLYYQSGFLPAWGARSAGLVLFAAYVEDAFNRGLQEIDLLRGDEPYKSEWTRERRATVAVRWALTASGRAALAWRQARARARQVALAALPQTTRAALSRVVRERRMSEAA